MERAQKAPAQTPLPGRAVSSESFDSDVFDRREVRRRIAAAVPEWDEHTALTERKRSSRLLSSPGTSWTSTGEKLRNIKVRRHRHCRRDEARAAGPPSRPRRTASERDSDRRALSLALRSPSSKRSGELYAQAALEDTTGKIELIAFPQSYEKLAEKLKIEVPVLVRGVLRGEEDSAPKLAISSIQALEDVKIKLPEALRIKVPLHNPDEALLDKLHAIRGYRRAGQGQAPARPRGAGHEFCAVLEPSGVPGRCRPSLYRPSRRACWTGRRSCNRIIESVCGDLSSVDHPLALPL